MFKADFFKRSGSGYFLILLLVSLFYFYCWVSSSTYFDFQSMKKILDDTKYTETIGKFTAIGDKPTDSEVYQSLLSYCQAQERLEVILKENTFITDKANNTKAEFLSSFKNGKVACHEVNSNKEVFNVKMIMLNFKKAILIQGSALKSLSENQNPTLKNTIIDKYQFSLFYTFFVIYTLNVLARRKYKNWIKNSWYVVGYLFLLSWFLAKYLSSNYILFVFFVIIYGGYLLIMQRRKVNMNKEM